MTAEVQWAQAREADACQAAYFRDALTGERRIVGDNLAEARAQLRECLENEKAIGLSRMARARFTVRDLEQQLRELDRMLYALDRRFTAAR